MYKPHPFSERVKDLRHAQIFLYFCKSKAALRQKTRLGDTYLLAEPCCRGLTLIQRGHAEKYWTSPPQTCACEHIWIQGTKAASLHCADK